MKTALPCDIEVTPKTKVALLVMLIESVYAGRSWDERVTGAWSRLGAMIPRHLGMKYRGYDAKRIGITMQ